MEDGEPACVFIHQNKRGAVNLPQGYFQSGANTPGEQGFTTTQFPYQGNDIPRFELSPQSFAKVERDRRTITQKCVLLHLG